MKIKEYLAIFKITQAQFAKEVGISRTALNQYINGKRSPTLEIAMKIYKASRGSISPHDLLNE